MLRIVMTILLLIAMATIVCPQGKSRAWLNGTWEGKGYQMDTDETWTMRLTVKGRSYRIEYPSLKCEGRWRPLAINSWRARFRETLTLGIDICTDKGKVVIEKLGRKQIAYRYANQGTNEVSASGILNRKK